MSRVRVAAVVTGLRAGQSGVRIPVGAKYFSRQCPDRLWGPPSLLLSEHQGSFLVVTRLGRETDHSTVPSAEVKSGWMYTSTATPPAFWTGKT
jgi:hypothetical protein